MFVDTIKQQVSGLRYRQVFYPCGWVPYWEMLHEAAQLSAGPTESIKSIQLRESEAVCIITTTGNNIKT